MLRTKAVEHLNGTASGGAPGKVHDGTKSTSSERSHTQSNWGNTSVRLSTTASASASRSACSCRRISSMFARSRADRSSASAAGRSPAGFGRRSVCFGSSPPHGNGTVGAPGWYSPSPAAHGAGSAGGFGGSKVRYRPSSK